MESPSSSSRRITRSQVDVAMAENNIIPISSRINEESEKGASKSRSALIDITNDSPIVGLAIGNLKTPLSTFSTKTLMVIENSKSKQESTLGSGEALLRGQVKTLLQNVEEEAAFSNISVEPINLVNSPMCFLAPTPANTPQVLENNNNCSESLTPSPCVTESFNFSKMHDLQEESGEAEEKNLITKLLFTDFPEKFDGCDSSTDSDEDASVWSLQVNASTSDEQEYDEKFKENYEDEEMDELCEVVNKICVNNGAAKISGKHKRFAYDSDGELEAEQELGLSSP